jgi:deazaflavin-dependent oxidoreductase (nitroreductase family)
MDDDLVRDGRFARLEIRGRRTGQARQATVGFVDEPDGRILVAAGGPDVVWARNLAADPKVRVTIGARSFWAIATELDDRDPLRARAVRELILRYGTPSERVGSGSIFLLTPTSDDC